MPGLLQNGPSCSEVRAVMTALRRPSSARPDGSAWPVTGQADPSSVASLLPAAPATYAATMYVAYRSSEVRARSGEA